MSIDKLQDKIRKMKNPSVLDLSAFVQQFPPELLQENADSILLCQKYYETLLDGLKSIIPAVRFDFNTFALMGSTGLDILEKLLAFAAECGYYVLLDGVQMLSPHNAVHAADILFDRSCRWYFDGLIIDAGIGSDAIRPYAAKVKETGKSLFVVARTANKSAPEMQDLLTGTRLAHIAKTDIVNRYAEPLPGRSGYNQIAIMAGASSADSLRSLRSKFKYLFILIDGSDYPNANIKNCSYAFDSLGHGAAVCAGASITMAWKECEAGDYRTAAITSAERLKKNIARYINVL